MRLIGHRLLNYRKGKQNPQTGYLLFLAAFADEVSSTQTSEQYYASADRCIVSVSVIGATVTRKERIAITVAIHTGGFFLGTTLEQTTAFGEGCHAQSEDDCDCQC